MKKISIWIDKVKDKVLPSLKEDIECDILVLGGGIAGLSTLYNLKDTNKKIVLIDKDKCGLGVTSNNTGKLTYMQGLIYHKLEDNYNSKVAKLYLDSQKEAIDTILKIIKDNNIDCDLVKTKAYVFSNDNEVEEFDREIKFYKENNIKYKVLSSLPIEYPSRMVLETYDSYTFNPYKYLISLKKILKINIYENTRCIDLEKIDNYYVCTTSDGYKIKANVVVVATHYPFFIVPYFTPFKTRVEKFFIGASTCRDNKDIQIISSNNPSISIRYYNKDSKNYLLYGRRSHLCSTKLNTIDDYTELKDEYRKYFNKDIEYFYHTHDLMTYDSMPFIGKIDSNLYIMTGFNKWGNTNGVIGSTLIRDLILGKKNRYEGIFNPKRSLSKDKIKNLIIFNIGTMTRYIINKINPNMGYYKDNVKVKYINGKRCGIYIDDDNREHIVSNICPHMKCNLVFNYIDKTWDCPCHQSRFDIDGNVIYGPSVYDIKIK